MNQGAIMGVPANLSVVVPAFNESQRIGNTLTRMKAWLDTNARGYEVIVVNDGSRDDTEEVVESYRSRWPELRCLNNPGNRGKGFSVRNGMLNAQGDFILFSDADLSTPIEDLERLAEHLQSADVVIGSRALAESAVEIHQPAYREFLGRSFNLAFQWLVLSGIRDSQCGFKLFTRGAARDVFSRLTIDGFGFDAEALFVAGRLGYRIKEVPVKWRNDERSKVHPLRDGTIMVMDLMKTRIRHRNLKQK